MVWRIILLITSVLALVACSPSSTSVEQNIDSPALEELTSFGQPQFLNSYADW